MITTTVNELRAKVHAACSVFSHPRHNRRAKRGHLGISDR